MGKHTWEGWQSSVSNAQQPTSILYGANSRASSVEDSPVEAGLRPGSAQEVQPAANQGQLPGRDFVNVSI
jgi:hypothetical protein